MEDHLLEIFGGHDTKEVITKSLSTYTDLTWNYKSQLELKFPVLLKVRSKEILKNLHDKMALQILLSK